MPDSVFPAFIRSRRWVVGVFFGLLALLGVALHRDYGMGWDEPAERLNAFVSAKYVALKLAPELARRQPRLVDIPDLRRHRDADHGVLFMLPWVGLEALRPGPDPAEWAYRRHLAGFLLFAVGAWSVYRLGRARLGNWRWGLVGAALLVLSPRIFAEAFYNYKDVVFLSLFALAVLTLTRLLRRPTAGRALVHALATAAAIDVRAMGVLLPLLTLGFGALEMWARPVRRRGLAAMLALYLPVLAALVVLGWPYLWESPWDNFRAALSSFGHYAKPLEVFYLGQFVSIQALPWHYAPVWLLITTPLPYVLLFAVGLVGEGRGLLKTGVGCWLRRTASRRDLLVLAWFFGPLLGVMVLHSAVYDGWRHLYFIYPAFVLLVVQGLRLLWQAWQQRSASLRWRPTPAAAGAALLFVAAGTAQVAWRMATEHPFQYAYFSFLPGHVIEQNFERDYWGLSVKQGLQWVLAHDARPAVPVSMDSRTEMTLRINAKMLPPSARARLRIVPPDSAAGGYFLSIHRWHPGAYPARAGQPVHVIRVGGAVILTVLRRP
ncbi:hypothetical protein [Hymenobacter siberiensis]|uniref:hypothetical protein n=1 Tax=Hymenobacter siberiensis TaxID=2848396 RepID=UPI001C1E5293|nr:hypothetical protein [Hymenobacter siberiensis]MBU6120352.1 hypothetical protein [Hymenobacter siberiensis]